ncbi:MAG: YebC/PmpR family DNA-binding transcriptional regulator [Patescibacteria group bacterium]|nr:YebC/PmpR family DNA-binding transcriptional regulator [Patescibacteria group bacterium]
MSGHSKWAKVKRQKGVADAKRGKVFTKLGNEISIAAREGGGGDPATNFKLRLTIDRARALNVPKENIERAIKRGTGEGGGGPIEEVIYEGFGVENIAVLVKALTDNRNRTVAEVKQIFNKHNGSLAGSNAVMWMFEKRGTIRISGKKLEDVELELIEAGAEDIKAEDDEIVVYTKVEDLQKVKVELDKREFDISDTDIEYVPKEFKKVNEATQGKLEKFFDALDDLDDVSDIYTNVEI